MALWAQILSFKEIPDLCPALLWDNRGCCTETLFIDEEEVLERPFEEFPA